MFRVLDFYTLCTFLLIVFLQNVQGVRRDIKNHPNWHLLDHDSCGFGVSSDRIIGGRNASLGQFPWIARIGYSILTAKSKPTYRCGGSLINKYYVLTAAHCVTNLPNGYVVSSVVLGEHDTSTEVDCEGSLCADPVQEFQPNKIILHPRYGKPAFKNDIALIKLSRPANYNGWVAPICMPSGDQLYRNYAGTTAEVAGWGISDMRRFLSSSVLLYVTMPIVDIYRCIESFRQFAPVGFEQLCVGGNVGQDSCAGDSGGPLMKVEAIHGPPRYYILGIVSFGVKECGEFNTPAVYTNIAAYVKWILDNIKE